MPFPSLFREQIACSGIDMTHNPAMAMRGFVDSLNLLSVCSDVSAVVHWNILKIGLKTNILNLFQFFRRQNSFREA